MKSFLIPLDRVTLIAHTGALLHTRFYHCWVIPNRHYGSWVSGSGLLGLELWTAGTTASSSLCSTALG